MHPDRVGESQAYRELQVCNPDIFDRYFQFSLSERELKQAEITSLISATGNRDRLVEEFEALGQRGLFEEAIDALDHHLVQVRAEDAVPFVTALLDIGDRITPGSEASFLLGKGQQVIRIIRRFLMGLADPAERARILETALADTQSLSLPTLLVAWEEDDQHGSRSSPCLLADEDLPKLRRICLEKILKAAHEQLLHSKPGLASILGGWERWGSLEDLRIWAEKAAQTPAGALALLVAFSFESHSGKTGDVVSKVSRGIHLRTLEKYVGLNTLVETILKLSPAGLRQPQADALAAFLATRSELS